MVYSRSDKSAQYFVADEFSEITGVDICVAESAEALVREADIVTLITSATEPIVSSSWWKPGTHINAVGSHARGIRELDTATVQMAKVICDQKQACLNEAGDIQIPVEEGVYSSDDIHGELGSVINGTIAGRENDEEITLFKSVGLAIQDISCASLVYEQAKEQGVGLEFDFTR